FFFFQAEDGIRDFHVTGVQTCALPILPWVSIVIGLALAVLGLAMLAGYEPSVRLPRLDRGGRERTVRSMFVFGVSYAITSIGCKIGRASCRERVEDQRVACR